MHVTSGLPPKVIKVDSSRLSPKDVVFIKDPGSVSWLRCELKSEKHPWFEVISDFSPEPYWIRLPKRVWALKITPWTRLKQDPPVTKVFRPGEVLHPTPRTADPSSFWNWGVGDSRSSNEYYKVEEREWRELHSRYWSSKSSKKEHREPRPKATPESSTWYTLLGVKAGVTLKELKKAYRKNAFKYHPDRCKSADAEDTFKKITSAYENLVKLFSQKR